MPTRREQFLDKMKAWDTQARTNTPEGEVARRKLERFLRRANKTQADLDKLLDELRLTGDADATDWGYLPDNATPDELARARGINALVLTRELLQQYVGASETELDAIALWSLHTYVYRQFQASPRLVLHSPVLGCGKSTVLDCLSILAHDAHKADSITTAAYYHRLQMDHPTMLLDQGEDLPLDQDGVMKASLNAYKAGSYREIRWKGQNIRLDLYNPLALAAIGRLYRTLMSRSVIINMKRFAGDLRQFALSDTRDLEIAQQMIFDWAESVQLNRYPDLPEGMRNRPAELWRPLISVADSFGPEWGVKARRAALELGKRDYSTDYGEKLLTDIRTLFHTRGVDRFFSEELTTALCTMEESPWPEWRGIHDNQHARALTKYELARLLDPFEIHPKVIWVRRGGSRKSASGYMRSQFESAWASYCGPEARQTPIGRLQGVA